LRNEENAYVILSLSGADRPSGLLGFARRVTGMRDPAFLARLGLTVTKSEAGGSDAL
jgi:hypothetical protein